MTNVTVHIRTLHDCMRKLNPMMWSIKQKCLSILRTTLQFIRPMLP